MDYRKLLWLYINHVGDTEGTTFLDHKIDPEWTPSPFTPEQWRELVTLNNMREYSDLTPV